MTTIKKQGELSLNRTKTGDYTIDHVFFAFGVKQKGICFGRWPAGRYDAAEQEFQALVESGRYDNGQIIF